MKFKILVLMLSPALAHAEMSIQTCKPKDNSFAVQVAYRFDGNFEKMAAADGETPTEAVLVLVARNGKTLVNQEEIQMSGSGIYSAKGPAFSLTGEKGITLEIAAPASRSDSELTMNGKSYGVTCQ